MDTQYIVIRPAPDLRFFVLPADMNGRWFDLDELPPVFSDGGVIAVAVDRFERRADGAIAQVYEVQQP